MGGHYTKVKYFSTLGRFLSRYKGKKRVRDVWGSHEENPSGVAQTFLVETESLGRGGGGYGPTEVTTTLCPSS